MWPQPCWAIIRFIIIIIIIVAAAALSFDYINETMCNESGVKIK